MSEFDKIMSELDNLIDFILQSLDYDDFERRFNLLLSIIVNTFEDEITRTKLPFFSYIIIDKLNDKLNTIVNKINYSDFLYADGVLAQNIFLLIIEDEYPQFYNNYLYQKHYRHN
jgi:hypothetical protein